MRTSPNHLLPAYMDYSLSDRPREIWKTIEGYKGRYMISNYGRVKSTGYYRISKRGLERRPREIIKQYVFHSLNKYHQDYTHQLTVRLHNGNKLQTRSVRRLVYYHFVAPFNLDNKGLQVLMKNNNGYDMQPNNLMLASVEKKVRRSVVTGRMVNTFSHVDKHQAGMASGRLSAKQVSQYDRNGQYMATFSSLHEAERQTGISHNTICGCCNGREHTAGGYYWQHGVAAFLDVTALLLQKKERLRQLRGTKVIQMDLQGKQIASYPSLQDAAEAAHCQWTSISACIRGIYKTAGGFTWKKIEREQK